MLTTPDTPPPMTPRDKDDPERDFWLSIREARLIELAAIEERLGLERSRETRKERKAREYTRDKRKANGRVG